KLHLDYYQAANELGYALRQTGDYRKALGAYNFALEIKPDFYPAVEYRGEAYLTLGMLEASREAYMTLFRNDLALARRLLQAMEAYAPRVDDPAFADWVAERKQLAALLPTSAPEAGDW
ncbi:MAG: tetratricopeptide repeat protein, partial [Gammaproteobacteria bacterium]